MPTSTGTSEAPSECLACPAAVARAELGGRHLISIGAINAALNTGNPLAYVMDQLEGSGEQPVLLAGTMDPLITPSSNYRNSS